MPSEVKGVVARARGEPVSLETIVVPDPGPGEAVVRCRPAGSATPTCTTARAGINDDFPFLLGHEAAGVVEAVGHDVTSVAPGDFVVLNWRAVCGECRSCRRGRPVVLLRHPQRHPEDDPGRRHPAGASPRHRRLRRQDAGGRGPVHQGRPGRPSRGGRAARAAGSWPDWARPCSPARSPSATRWPCSAAGEWDARRWPAPAWPAPSTIIAVDLDREQARPGPPVRGHRTRSMPPRRTRSRPSAGSPAATAPTSASRRWATPRSWSRRSTPGPGRDPGAGGGADPGHAASTSP